MQKCNHPRGALTGGRFSPDPIPRKYPMSLTYRVFLAIFILLVDLVIFFLPITAALVAYVLIFNPPWFREFINRLNSPGKV
jgi:hypothetical protein